jgi:4-amino-4-deoxy-L-arabinose transferase-like glycosyltransferase
MFLLIPIIASILFLAMFNILPHSLASAEQHKFLEIVIGFLALLIFVKWTWFLLNRLSPGRSLIVIVGVALILRGLWTFSVHNELVSDFAIYHELAQALTSGQGYTLTGPVAAEDFTLYLGTDKRFPYPTAHRAPGTALWAALLIKLFGDHVLIFKISNILLSAGTVILIYFLLDPAKNHRLARGSAFLWALYPPSIMATNLFGSEILFTFFLILLAFISSKWREDWLLKLPALGLLTAWTALIRSTLAVLVASMIGILCFRLPCRKAIVSSFIFMLFVALGLVPWTLRNWNVFHRFIPVCTNEGEFLGRHTTYLLFDNPKDLEENPRYMAWRSTTDEASRSIQGYTMAIANWQEILGRGPAYIGHVLFRTLQKTYSTDDEILFWSVKRSYGIAQFPGPPTALPYKTLLHWRWFTAAFYFFVLFGSLVGMIVIWTKNMLCFKNLHFLAATFILFFAANTIVLAKPRYHFAMMPFLVILSAAGYLHLLKKLQPAENEKAIPPSNV